MSIEVSPMDKDMTVTSFWKACFKNPMKMSNILEQWNELKTLVESLFGDWKKGNKEGRGTYTYPNGSKFSGEWKNDRRNGQGTFTWGNGDKYVGEWKDGNRIAWTNKDPYGQSDTNPYSQDLVLGEGGDNTFS